jgi:hypothetical protein
MCGRLRSSPESPMIAPIHDIASVLLTGQYAM